MALAKRTGVDREQLPDWLITLFTELLESPLPPRSLPKTTELYHYTNADGLKGIIEEGCLHAGSAYFLNDTSEIAYGCNVLREAVNNSAKDFQDDEQLVELIGILLSNLGLRRRPGFIDMLLGRNPSTKQVLTGRDDPYALNEPRPAAKVYVACFCEDGNLLSQWRAYGQAGGYAIGFSLNDGGIDLKVNSPRVTAPKYCRKFVSVNYDRNDQLRRLTKILDGLRSAIGKKTEKIKEQKDHWQQYRSLVAFVIEEVLLEEIASFKNPAFRMEKECRIVVRLPSIREELFGQPDGVVDFKTSKGLIVPFVRLTPNEGSTQKLPLKTVRFGPSLDRRRGEESLRQFLRCHGYGDTEIEGSEIPVLLD